MEALKTIFKGNNRRPKTIRFDQGGQFKSNVKKYLDKGNIHALYTQNSQIKSNYTEKVIRTIKKIVYIPISWKNKHISTLTYYKK